MKRLIPLFLILCLCLCACKNDATQPTQSTQPTVNETTSNSEPTEETVPETTLKHVDVPEGLKCVCYFKQNMTNYKILTDDQAADVYVQLMSRLPERNKSNPGYALEGQTITLVFYTGDTFAGTWSDTYTYHGVFDLAENGVLAQTGSPFTSVILRYQLTPELYTLIDRICIR